MSGQPPEGDPASPSEPHQPPVSGLEIFALCGFAIAAPLFDLLGRNAEFFVAHGSGAGLLFQFALGLILLPPLACFTAHRAVSLLGPRAARLSGLTWVGLLLGATALIPLLRTPLLEERGAYALAATAGVLGAIAYARLPRAAEALRFLALAPLAFTALFFSEPGLRPFLRPETPTTHVLESSDAAPPIVIVVFDELPLSSIQDATGNVNASRFPAFAALAQEGRFFTGLSTVAVQTDLALPALLTGRYPEPHYRPPILAAFPDNLLSLLEQRYRLNVMESVTLFHPQSPLAADLRSTGRKTLAPDVALLYMHLVLPEAIRVELPSVSNGWGHFWQQPDARSGGIVDQAIRRRRVATLRMTRKGQIDLDRFSQFLASVDDPSRDARPPLHFVHVIFPHEPWRILPAGSMYLPDKNFARRGQMWPSEPWWSTDGYRRHLLQSMHADRLLAELVESLKRQRIYDRAIVAVIADHGASFWPSSTFRATSGGDHPEDILAVPLIIKAPAGPRGVRLDRYAELIDFLPTLAELADFDVPWEMHGCSLLATDCAERPKRRLYEMLGKRANRLVEYPAEITNRRATLERKLTLFGEDEIGLYRAGRGGEVVGRRVTELDVSSETVGRLRVDESVRAIWAGKRPGLRPGRLVGFLQLAERPATTPEVALALDGVIEVVFPVPRAVARIPRVSAMLPERLLDRVPAGLSAYLLDNENAEPVLHPLEIR